MAIAYAFDECLLDPNLFSIPHGGESPFSGGPEFANIHTPNSLTGVVKTAVGRFDELERGVIDLTIMSPDHFAYLLNFILGGYGSAVGFRVRFPHYHSVTLETIAGPGGIQVPNGALTQFKLYRSAIRPGITARSNVKRILKPAVQEPQATGVVLYEPDGVTARKFVGDANAPITAPDPFKVYFGAVEQTSGWTVDVTTGIITFSVAPPTSTVIKWSGSYDLPMAFTDNFFNFRADVVGQVQSVGIREIGHAELGIAY